MSTPLRPKLIAVTVLTSINQEDWEGLGYQSQMKEQVVRLAKLAQKAGLDGVVASPQEAKAIEQLCGRNMDSLSNADAFQIVNTFLRWSNNTGKPLLRSLDA